MENPTVRVGCVGLGRLGHEHAYNLKYRVPGATLAALCVRTESRLHQVADELGVAGRYTDFAAMCADPELDAVAIASPSGIHAEQIEIALTAGKHVFCDKPLDTSITACKRAERAVEAHPDQVFLLGYVRHFDRSYQKAKAKIDAGDIGRIVMIRSYTQDPIRLIDGAIRFGPQSGGQFSDMSVHDIEVCHWLTGGVPVRNLWAIGGCFEFPQFRDWNDGDNVSALLQLEDDTMVYLFAGRAAAHGYNIETEIIGTRGTLRVGSVGTDSMLEVLSEHGVCRECHPDFISRFSDAFIAEMNEFICCINEHRQPEITVYDGTAVSEIAHRCKASFESGRMLPFRD